jgi:hypothetical protein
VLWWLWASSGKRCGKKWLWLLAVLSLRSQTPARIVSPWTAFYMAFSWMTNLMAMLCTCSLLFFHKSFVMKNLFYFHHFTDKSSLFLWSPTVTGMSLDLTWLLAFSPQKKIGANNCVWSDYYLNFWSVIKQSKAVPLHTMMALGGRGGIAPTHSWPRH